MSSPQLFESAAARQTLFVEVVLPLSIAKSYTYRVPEALNEKVKLGVRVIVQFGKNRIYAAIVERVTEEAPLRYEAKYILDVVDEQGIVGVQQLDFWHWIADYYMCHLGDVMQAALPAALKMASETKIRSADQEDLDRSGLNDKAFLVMDALDVAGELRISDVIKILGQKTVFPLLKSLFDKGFILISEEIKQKYKPKVKTFFTLSSLYSDSEGKRLLLDSLNRAPTQQDAVLAFMQLQKQGGEITRQDIMEASGCGSSAITALIDKGVFDVKEKVVSRFQGTDIVLQKDFTFSTPQQQAYDQINEFFEEKDVVLLHGVTASGKTQLYVRLIEKALAQGQQVLFLLPEIALTAQITERLKLYFGDQLGVYHSKFNDNERAEVWYKVLNGELKIIVGARSAVLLPFQNLGLIVVDEEHESSYKQFEPAPRYHARDAAIYLANSYDAKVLLGSATPSVESFYNAKAGKYGLVTLSERFGEVQLPAIEIIHVTEEGKKDQMVNYFSKTLLKGIEDAVAQKEQVILFQNRRGHTPFLQCKTCGYVAKCVQCDVSLTYHKSSNLLHCHYCGFSEDTMQVCPACGSTHLENKGYGTERIEEELELLMPDLRIGRLDLDSTRGKHGFDKVITAFDDHEFDVLIGTQMVAKGLDFGRVNLIGIINADAMINFPDFRSYERAYSLFSQVAGRSGRRQTQGRVIIQTYSPNHRVLEQVVQHDYLAMFTNEITERKSYHYPPFYRLIRLDVKHTDQDKCLDSANKLANLLRTTLEQRVLGPEQPLVARIRNYYIQTITLKVERTGISIVKVKELIRQALLHFELDKKNSGVRVVVDVDPY
ncbi:replication restart helicase PriA [Sphingobacterium corticibacter]|uniref:Replication restart protein PriA n=1 Tax=Sphingobacterium corticibacter TaxID=2171749 RepID=A0A2T8HF71_9SPHI|nr:primosomal protein N' [Sphingobacterium corticibacter]PVH24053.1 primosomal protein N' [Sphingobacterium corticibacter]